MNKVVVHKSHLLPDQDTVLDVPVEAFKIIHTEEQNGVPTVWYETIKTPIMTNKVTLCYIGTGMNIPDNSTHIGSCRCGVYMWHVYQINKGK